MPLDIENKLVTLIEGQGELLQRLARVEQKVDDHIRVEDAWRATVETAIAARRSWWQTIVVSITSSGLVMGIWHFLTAKK